MKFFERVGPAVTTVVAIVALYFSVSQFKEAQLLANENLEIDREAKAVELFIKFNELQEGKVLKDTSDSKRISFWRENTMMGVTEAVFNLTEGSDKWGATINWMLNVQREFIAESGLNCGTYSEDFIKYMRMYGEVKCS